MMVLSTRTIYIKLLNEGTDVWHPTQGEEIAENIFKVLPTDNYKPDIEEWEFLPGTIVKCELKNKYNELILIATNKG